MLPKISKEIAPHLNKQGRQHIALMLNRVKWLDSKIEMRILLRNESNCLFLAEQDALIWAIEQITQSSISEISAKTNLQLKI